MRRRSSITFAIALGLWSVAAAASAASSGGQSPLGTSFPPGFGPKIRSGLTATLDDQWLPANGYRPVTIHFTPVSPLPTLRTLEVEIMPSANRMMGNGLRVRRTVYVPAGSAGASETILVPQWETWEFLSVNVYEDGKRIDDLSSAVGVNNESGPSYATTWFAPGTSGNTGPRPFTIGRSPSILSIGISSMGGDAVPALPVMTSEMGMFQQARFLSAGATDPPGTTDPSIPLAQLPDSWLCYSGFDAVLVRFDKLQDLVKNHPAQWTAIRRSIAAGGNLWVYGIGDQWRHLAELEPLVGVEPILPVDGAAAQDPSQRGWRLPGERPDTTDDAPAQNPGGGLYSRTRPLKTAVPKRPTDAGFVIRSFGRGEIVAIQTDDVFKSGKRRLDWLWLQHEVGPNRWQWVARSGVALDPDQVGLNTTSFWQFLIPGVGVAPVLQFQIMISLFIIVIGPLNYWLLRRWQKLNLLPLTVGAGAIAVTLALFGYAFVHDGFGIRVRVRSLTALDQQRGEAVCWSRLSYYAGLSPSRGLQFSGDVAVYPMRIPQQLSRSPQEPRLQLDWVDDSDSRPTQLLSTDWLPARVPTQLVTARVAATAARLNVAMSDQGHAAKIENHLGAKIRLVVVAAPGHFFKAENIADNDRAAMRETDAVDARTSLSTLIHASDLQIPAGADANWFESSAGTYGLNAGDSTDIDESGSILERGLRSVTELKPHTFAAITETSPEVEIGTSASEEASLHVVVGRW